MSAPVFDHLMGPLNQLLRSRIKNMAANLWHPNLLSHHLKLCDGPFRLAAVHNWVLSLALVHYLCQIIPPFASPVHISVFSSLLDNYTSVYVLNLSSSPPVSLTPCVPYPRPISLYQRLSFQLSFSRPFPVISSPLLPSSPFPPLPLSRLHCVSKREEVVKHFSSLLIVLTCAIGIPIRAHWFPSAKCIDFYISYWSRF